METTLTIAIPTYNRAAILSENLKSFLGKIDDKIQVLVSDNFSNDDTEEVCISLVKIYPNFKYFKNEKNLGYDANVLNSLLKSNSKYVWFLSDDDFVTPEIINEIFHYLNGNSPAGILVNAIVKDKDSGSVLIESLGITNKDKKEFCDDNTFQKYIQWSTLISSIIIQKQKVDLQIAKNYIGSCFIQLYIFWGSCANEHIYIYGSKKIVKYDSEKPSFNLSNYEIWFKSWIKVINSFKSIYSVTAIKNASTGLYVRSRFNQSGILTYVILCRAYSIISLNDLSLIYCSLNLSIYQKIIIFIVLCIPAQFLLLLINISKKIKLLSR
ncbi:glycosyltransferase family 2 protein [Flavobacterium sp.]|jgi:glycosyltransferase involved in cell wall biosynthesis|uniref:glycosyltransferase family 2 protein n=1 Tax=Flavobacterium sp. TaxID=239 RepID=UPI0022CAC7CC|nr:glycosyltransferase family 2 protein [Flavobacterium sp.]MCZ8230045.1 glycosyltransferase family 2 protein [Flavobacterium sp.]